MPTTDLAGLLALPDDELDRLAGKLLGSEHECTCAWTFSECRAMHPVNDRNHAARLVEECGRRGLEEAFAQALASVIDAWKPSPLGEYAPILLAASATARQVTAAAVAVLGEPL